MKRNPTILASLCACFAFTLLATPALADAPTPPDTQWKVTTAKSTYVILTETGIPDGQTPWKFYLKSGGGLSVAAKVDATSSKKINLRTLPADCPFTITSTGYYRANNNGYFMNNGVGGTASQAISKSAGAIIEEIYFPDTLKSLGQYSFANCTNLVVCDFTENSQLTTIGYDAIYQCNKLEHLRLTDSLKTIGGKVNNAGGIQSCGKMQIDGPTLSANLTSLGHTSFRYCPNAFHGRLTLGGSDTNDLTTTDTPTYMFGGCTGITEVVFGKAVTKFASSYAFDDCTGITNIVCRNPDGFNFGTYFSKLPVSGLKQYDLYGWPQGTLKNNSYKTRILAPRDNATWLALVADETVFLPWGKMTDAQKNTYWNNFPTNGVDEVLIPEGRIAGSSGSKTFSGCTIGYGVWVVFDKGEEHKTTSLTVKGEKGDYAPAAGEPAFSPDYGFTLDVKKTFGASFPCTAPRYVDSGKGYFEITGLDLIAKDTNDVFTVVVTNETFVGEAARSWTFDTAVWTNDAYQLVWKMTSAGYTLDVASSGGTDYVAVTNEPPFAPAYGTSYGLGSYTCSAPRYAGSSADVYEITGFELLAKDTNGVFSVVVTNGVNVFAGEDVRTVTLDGALLTTNAYKLVWLMGDTAAGTTLSVVAPAIDGLGTWEIDTAPNFKGKYYTPDTEVSITATGEEGHPFVMWGVQQDMWNPTRYDATLRLVMNRNWTVYPTFKTDCWKFTRTSSSGDYHNGFMTDGAWSFYVRAYTNSLAVKIRDDAQCPSTLPYCSYVEEIDFAKPIQYTNPKAGEPDELTLSIVGAIRGRIPSSAQQRLRKLSFGSGVQEVSSYAFYTSPAISVSNLTDIVFGSAPTVERWAFVNCKALRRITCKAGIPSASNYESIQGDTDYAVTITVPRDNEDWQTFVTNTAYVTRWANCTQAQKNKFEQYHPVEHRPFGLIKSNSKFNCALQWLTFDHWDGTMLIVR